MAGDLPAPAVVLIDHGSRQPAAAEQLEAVAGLLRERLPGRLVQVAHLELISPSFPEAIDACVSAGAREITVLPHFLVAGRHGVGDLQQLADEAAKRHPQLKLRVAEPLGVHPGLADVLLTRLSESEDPLRSR